MNPENLKIPVFVANLKKRKDRLAHIKEQFEGKGEFNVTYIKAVEHEIGAVGLWHTLSKCVSLGKNNDEDFIIFCEDDHIFTENYRKKFLLKNIMLAGRKEADLLICGSAGGFSIVIPVSKDLMWVNRFWSTQFIVIYKKFFNTILKVDDFDPRKQVDNYLAEITVHKFLLFPYISKQKTFGYSDVTNYNDDFPEELEQRFEKSEKYLDYINNIYNYYR